MRDRDASESGSVRPWAAYVTLAVGAALSVGAWLATEKAVRKNRLAEFAVAATEATRDIELSVARKIDLLRALRGLIHASGGANRASFRQFARALELNDGYVGLQALQFVRPVPADQLNAYQNNMRAELARDTLYTGEFKVRPAEASKEVFVVEMVWPLVGNEDDLGRDAGRDSVRRLALERARDGGMATGTGPLRMLALGDQPVYVIRMPLYRDGVLPASVEGRRSALIGFASVKLRANEFISHALGPRAEARFHVSILDQGFAGEPPSADERVFGDESQPGAANGEALRKIERLIVADRNWRIELVDRDTQLTPAQRGLPLLVLGAGLALSLLLAAVLRTMSRTRCETQALAGRMTHRLVASEERFRGLIEAAQDCVMICGEAGDIRYVSPRVQSMLGYAPGDMIGRRMTELLRTDERELVVAGFERACHQPGSSVSLTHHARAEDGSWRLIRTKLRDMRQHAGIDGMVLNCQDITEREQVREALILSEQRLQIALDASGVALWEFDLQTRRVHLSSQWAKQLGLPPGDTDIGMLELLECAHPEDREMIHQAVLSTVRGETSVYRADHRVRSANGDWLWIESVGRVVERDAQGRALRMAGTNSNVSERKKTEARIAHLVFHDALTGLPNRQLLADRIAQSILQSERHGEQMAVLLLDLDRFKLVNEMFDHAHGDRVLELVAARLVSALRDGDTLARLSSDEFVVVLSHVDDASQAAALGQRLLDSLVDPLQLDGQPLQMAATLGISLYPEDGSDVAALMRSAEAALAHGKASARGQLHFHRLEVTERARRDHSVERELRGAVARGEMEIMYQPLINVGSGLVVGAEALLRWNHAELGHVAPSDFIPIAEESDLILGLGEWVLELACLQARQWQLGADPHFGISVNLAIAQLAQAELPAIVERVLAGSKIARGSLTIEITETHLMSNDEQPLAMLHWLKQGASVKLAIDDFGTGYSNLGYLRRLPVDSIKIDRVFVQNIDERPEDAALVEGIVSIARALGLAVTAEGVETEAQYRRVRALGCDQVQGYLTGRPMSAQALTQLLQAQKVDSVVGA